MQQKGRARAVSAALAACALTLAVCAAMLCGCGGSAAQSEGSGTLRVGVRDDIVNFSYLNEQTGKYYGFEVDLAEEMAARMGYADVEFVTVEPDTRKEMLLNGDVDCVAACYSIAESRLENFDFSPAYYTDEPVIMVENSSLITGVEQLSGLNIGTMSGANTSPILATRLFELGIIGPNVISNTDEGTQYEGVYVTKIDSYQALSQALEEGTVDAVAMDGSFSRTYMNDDRSTFTIGMQAQEYGVATQKDSALSQPVSDAIQSMLDDGTVDALIDKWN